MFSAGMFVAYLRAGCLERQVVRVEFDELESARTVPGDLGRGGMDFYAMVAVV